METFIQDLARDIYNRYADRLEEVTVVFPNRRAGLYFNQALGALITKPIWMPGIMSLEDFVYKQVSVDKIDTLEGIFLLYETYKEHQKKEEGFDKFFFWGEMILRDFEEIDHYLIDPDQLFRSIKTQKELDEEFYFLDEHERKVIEQFWMTFVPEATKSQQAFIETWKILHPVYRSYKELLRQKRKGYNGMVYRDYLINLREDETEHPGKVIFCGFNALTKAEEGIIKHFISSKDAEIKWDLDGYYVNSDQQEAGFFLRQHLKDDVFRRTIPNKLPARISEPKDFQLTSVSLEVGQAKAMGEDLQKLIVEKGIDPSECVIVLPQEYMLFPVLHALPDEVASLNITMGYPMKDSGIQPLVENLMRLQHLRRDSIVHGSSYRYQPVVELLLHPLIQPLLKKKHRGLVDEIKKRNLIFIYEDELPAEPEIFAKIFQKANDPLEYVSSILQMIHEQHHQSGHQLELEFIARYHELIEELQRTIGQKARNLSYDFLVKLFRRLGRSLKIPFTGEPLAGLQIMGILETRNLDFEHVFILNMNEDSWPAAPRRGSFVPYNIRRAFELPVHEHQDAIYAYLFYRLIQRASNVHIYYNSVAEFNVNGELSRFVRQLQFESSHNFTNRVLANPIRVKPHAPISIEKTEKVLARLEKFVSGEGREKRRLSPSALDTYLTCRLKFYFRYIEEMYEPEDMQAEMDPMLFGNILHDAMEILYDQFTTRKKSQVMEPNDFFWLEGGVEGSINKAFIKHYKVKNEKKFKLEGRNIIAADIIEKTMRNILKYDQGYAPFKILGLEASTRHGYAVDLEIQTPYGKKKIALKGKIDRIDIRKGVVRILDYKTGKDTKEYGEMSSLVDREIKRDKVKAVFQVFFYSYLFYKTSSEDYERIEPGLFNSRELWDPEFDWKVSQKLPKQKAQPVTNFEPLASEFEELLKGLLSEIWNPDIPFDQVTDIEKCKYCPYLGICGRD
jgi:CRISPR/Cas system-associated exonuclease Cas4 (RecB family)